MQLCQVMLRRVVWLPARLDTPGRLPQTHLRESTDTRVTLYRQCTPRGLGLCPLTICTHETEGNCPHCLTPRIRWTKVTLTARAYLGMMWVTLSICYGVGLRVVHPYGVSQGGALPVRKHPSIVRVYIITVCVESFIKNLWVVCQCIMFKA